MTALSSRDLGTGGPTPARVVNSEWIKLRTVPSTVWALLAAVAFEVGLGILITALRANRWNHLSLVERLAFDPTAVSLRGAHLAQLAIGVLGVLVVTGEYSTGMIRASLSAVPRRFPILVAKAGVFAIAVFVVTGIASLVAFLAGQAALRSTHVQASLSTPGAGRAVLGAALYLTLIGLFGVGLGFLLRRTAGAIATLVALLLVLPGLAQALPSPWSTDVTKVLPMPAGTAIMSTRPDPELLGPWSGLAVCALYVVAALIGGALVLHRRDA